MQQTSRPGVARILVLLPVALVLWAAVPRAGQESKSSAAARELSQVLATAKLDAMAVADPASPGTFIAAIYIPETQLLVVSANYSAPSLLTDKIKAGDFRGVYMDLHAAGTAGTRVFVQDMGPDGLVSRNDNGDSWEEAGKTTTFDGQWKKTKLTEAEYTKTFSGADERYAKMLALLLGQSRQAKGGTGS